MAQQPPPRKGKPMKKRVTGPQVASPDRKSFLRDLQTAARGRLDRWRRAE